MNADSLQPQTQDADSATSEFDDDAPSGQHAVEIAARAGFGPLSPLAKQVWHGEAVPCVSCGQLVRRGDGECDQCGQDLSDDMIDKMRAHAGPWFVLEHVRPFPGVSLERIVRQIRRGLIGETSIVRGPSTDYQWRFAVEAPGLCRYFGRCWHCHQQVVQTDNYCRHCLSFLSFERPRLATPVAPSAPRPPSAPSLVGQERPLVSAEVSARGTHEPVGGLSSPRMGGSPPAGGRATSAASGSPQDESAAGEHAMSEHSPDLARLSAAARRARRTHTVTEWDEPPRFAGIRATWIAAALMIVAVVVLLMVSRTRSERSLSAPPAPVLPAASPPPVLLPAPTEDSGSPPLTVESPETIRP